MTANLMIFTWIENNLKHSEILNIQNFMSNVPFVKIFEIYYVDLIFENVILLMEKAKLFYNAHTRLTFLNKIFV